MRELASALDITVGAVRKAIADGRITSDSYKLERNRYVFNTDKALSDYHSNTLKTMARGKDPEDPEDEDPGADADGEEEHSKSPFGTPKENWTLHQSAVAKTIKQFEKAEFELQLMQGKYYLRTDVDNEILRITNVFGKNLNNMALKIDMQFGEEFAPALRTFFADLVKETLDSCASQLDPAAGEDGS